MRNLLLILLVSLCMASITNAATYLDITNMTAWDSSHYPGRDAMQLLEPITSPGFQCCGPDTHTDDGPYMWLVDNVVIADQWCIFDLNDVYDLQSVKIWNYNESAGDNYLTRAVRDMEILVADTIAGLDYATPLVITDLALAPGNTSSSFGEVISLGTLGIAGRYVKFNLYSCWGGYPSGYAGLSEVRFIGALSNYASNPYPEMGAIDIAKDVTLQWDAPTSGAVETFYYEVYYSTDPNLITGVTNLTTAAGITQAQVSPDLQQSTDYYWRVDTVHPGGPTYAGTKVWTFRTMSDYGRPVLVNPAPSGVADVEPNVVLEWSSDPAVEEHEVFFGPAGAVVSKGIQVAETYSPDNDPTVDMQRGQTYEWRIDEIVGGQVVAVGDTWSFTTHVLVCDPPLLADTNGDCIIDFLDLSQMASEWLKCNLDIQSACP